mmetsp:Transcript_30830/g.69511  ORF Transcript_30830/g.69511 Transcript_30830/m.69511 type:complete len:987 (-) Transcript_30830:683-3643(-)|eukprot:763942-Hanusia_phi.AAC.4
MSASQKRITLQSLEPDGARVTALCGSSLQETKELIGVKLGFPRPSTCRLFNKHGAEIDHLDLVIHDDLLYVSAGSDPILSRNSSKPVNSQVQRTASTLAPFGASTIDGMDHASTDEGKSDYFEIGKVLGTGGQGTTYLATDKRTGQQTVLKQIYCSGLQETNKAIEEAMMLSRLKHRHVVSYNEVFLGSDLAKGNYVGIVMEFCSGGDLYQMLCRQRSKKKPISVRRVKMWILQLCEALKYLHSQKVIHRDVKPMNVLLDSEGDLKIADFGLARHGVTQSKLAMTQCGTPGYESPEVQMGHGYDFKTDIWGLGCVVCDMTTLKFMHERPGSLATQVQVDPKAIVKVIQPVMDLYGPDIHSLLSAMLQSDPKKRPSAAEIVEYKFLKPSPAAEAEPVLVKGPGSSPPPAPRRLTGQRGSPSEQSDAQRLTAEPMGAGANYEHSMSPNTRLPRRSDDSSDSGISNRFANMRASETLYVSKRPGRDQFGSISQALRAASDGMTIEIMEGKYQEELFIDKAITLQASQTASGYCRVEIQGVTVRPVVVCSASGALVKGLSLIHLSQISKEGRDCTRCIDVAGGSLILEECDVTSVCGVGVVIRDGARLSAYRCRVNRCGQNGFFLFGKGGALIDGCDICENSFPGVGMDDSVDTIVRRCRIRHGKGDGIKIYGGSGIQIQKNDISHNGQVGISIEDGADPVVRENSIHDGNSCGVSVLKGGKGTIEDNDIYCNAHPNVYVANSADPLIRGNQIHHSGSCGVTCVEEGLGTIEENDIFCNQSVGLYIMNRANPVVRNNTIRESEGDGISVCFAGRGLIDGNTIQSNAGIGLLIESEAEPRVTKNTIVESHSDGIKVSHNGKGYIESNTVLRAGHGAGAGSGICITMGSAPVVKNNLVKDCLQHGVLVTDESAGIVERNTISGQQGNGIAILRRANPIVRGNVVRENKGIGIFVSQAGRGMVSDNRLSHNRGQSQLLVEPGCDATVRDNIIS